MIVRWLLLFSLISVSYLSGFFDTKKEPQLFFRNMPHVLAAKQTTNNIKDSKRFFANSQIQELGIGYGKSHNLPIPNHKEVVSDKPAEWGVAKQIDKYTWTLQVGQDSKNGTASEILTALNKYRQRYGRSALSWDDKLAQFAQDRATYFTKQNDLDGHAGFSDYLNSQDGFHKLGFANIGENSSYGYTLEAVHLIEWVYAGDKPHNDNQLSNKWAYVGIGVSGTATDLVFAGNKL